MGLDSKRPSSRFSPSSLRRRAEEALKGKTLKLEGLSTADIEKVIHELQVHQVELEIQNENLRQTQEELEEARRKYSNLYDFAPMGYFTLDKRGLIMDVNLTGATLLETQRARLLGMPFGRFVTDPHQETLLFHRKEVLANPKPQTCELVLKSKKGTTFDARLESINIANGTGNAAYIRTAVVDITESRRLAEHLHQQEKLAAIGHLAGGIAHDFNNILFSITASAEVVLKHPDTSPYAQKRVQRILTQANRAAQLVAQLLDFSRRGVNRPAALELCAFLQECLSLLQRTISEKIYIKLDCGLEAEPYWVKADKVKLEQAILNLAINARDAMPGGGVLSITLQRKYLSADAIPRPEMSPGEWIVIHLSDTGSGIPADVLPQVMDPFFTTKPVGKGTGLGLSQVYGIMQQHKGFTTVESEEGRGTTVSLYLRPHRSPAPLPATKERIIQKGQGETILLVEDEESVLQPGRELLTALGYQVLTASNGREGLNLYRQHHTEIDLVILDMVMPQMGGFELFHALQEINPDVKGIVISGYSLADQAKQLKAMGLSGYIQKPFSMAQLSETVGEALKSNSGSS